MAKFSLQHSKCGANVKVELYLRVPHKLIYVRADENHPPARQNRSAQHNIFKTRKRVKQTHKKRDKDVPARTAYKHMHRKRRKRPVTWVHATQGTAFDVQKVEKIHLSSACERKIGARKQKSSTGGLKPDVVFGDLGEGAQKVFTTLTEARGGRFRGRPLNQKATSFVNVPISLFVLNRLQKAIETNKLSVSCG